MIWDKLSASIWSTLFLLSSIYINTLWKIMIAIINGRGIWSRCHASSRRHAAEFSVEEGLSIERSRRLAAFLRNHPFASTFYNVNWTSSTLTWFKTNERDNDVHCIYSMLLYNKIKWICCYENVVIYICISGYTIESALCYRSVRVIDSTCCQTDGFSSILVMEFHRFHMFLRW